MSSSVYCYFLLLAGDLVRTLFDGIRATLDAVLDRLADFTDSSFRILIPNDLPRAFVHALTNLLVRIVDVATSLARGTPVIRIGIRRESRDSHDQDGIS